MSPTKSGTAKSTPPTPWSALSTSNTQLAAAQLEAGVVEGLDCDDVGGEVGAELEADPLIWCGFFGFDPESEHGELLVGLQHGEFRTEDDAGDARLVVVDLHAELCGTGYVTTRAVGRLGRRLLDHRGEHLLQRTSDGLSR